MQTRKLRLSGEIDFHAISKRTPGFVGADLAALVKEAAALAVKRCFQRLTAEAPAPMVVPIIEEGSKEAEAAAALQRTQAWSARARDRLPLTPLELDGLAISMRDLEEAVGKVRS